MSLSLILQAYADDVGEDSIDWEVDESYHYRQSKFAAATGIDNTNIDGIGENGTDTPISEPIHSSLSLDEHKVEETHINGGNRQDKEVAIKTAKKKRKRTGNRMWTTKSPRHRKRSTRPDRINVISNENKSKRNRVQVPNSSNNAEDSDAEHDNEPSPPFSPMSDWRADQDQANLTDDEGIPVKDYHDLQLQSAHNPYLGNQNQQPETDQSSQTETQKIIDSSVDNNCAGGKLGSSNESPKTTEQVVQENSSIPSRRPPRKCQHCALVFYAPSHLLRHMRIHQETDSRPWKCSKCPSFLVASRQLRAHVRTEFETTLRTLENNVHGREKGPSLYPCRVCGRKFKQNHLVVHMVIHSQHRPFKCSSPKCSKTYKLVAHLKGHLRACHGIEKSTQELRSSLQNGSPEDKVDINQEEARNDKVTQKHKLVFRCPYCPTAFLNGTELIVHLRSHKKAELNQPKIFPQPASSPKHCNPKGQRIGLCLERFKLRPCQIILTRCDKLIFNPSKSAATSTTKVGAGGMKYHVMSCNDKKDSLIQMRRQAGRNQFDCKTCSKTFPERWMARRHVIAHMNLRQFQCTHDQCSMRFSFKQTLQRHQQTHSGERNHPCHKCGKKFATGASLKRHIQSVHEGGKRFKCSRCEKVFSNKSNLQRHGVVHNRQEYGSNAEIGKKQK